MGGQDPDTGRAGFRAGQERINTMASGQMVPQATALKTIAEYINGGEVKAALASAIPTAMRKTLTADRAVRAAWQTILSNPKEFAKCTPKSIGKAITEAATHGLMCDGVTGQAYLIRFGDTCVMMPGYRGKISLALRGPNVVTINAHAIFANDKFVANIARNEVLEHTPHWMRGIKDPGDCLGYYATAKMRSGAWLVAPISFEEVTQIRNNAKRQRGGKDTLSWKEWPHEMGKKCAIHRLGKRLDLDPSAAAAFMRDDLLLTRAAEEAVVVDSDPNDLSNIVDQESTLNMLAGAMEQEDATDAEVTETETTDTDNRPAKKDTGYKDRLDKILSAKAAIIAIDPDNGKSIYYTILGGHGVEHANELSGYAAMDKVADELKSAWEGIAAKKMKAQKGGEQDGADQQ